MDNVPISILTKRFSQDLIKLINASGLPFCIIESVMLNQLANIKALSAAELERDLAAFKEAQQDG